jgi:hypothetical protein
MEEGKFLYIVLTKGPKQVQSQLAVGFLYPTAGVKRRTSKILVTPPRHANAGCAYHINTLQQRTISRPEQRTNQIKQSTKWQ